MCSNVKDSNVRAGLRCPSAETHLPVGSHSDFAKKRTEDEDNKMLFFNCIVMLELLVRLWRTIL